MQIYYWSIFYDKSVTVDHLKFVGFRFSGKKERPDKLGIEPITQMLSSSLFPLFHIILLFLLFKLFYYV